MSSKKRILFTKSTQQKYLEGLDSSIFDIELENFIKIQHKDYKDVIPYINKKRTTYFVSSMKILPYVKNLKGEFYVVGEKTAEALKDMGKNVVLSANSALELTSQLNGDIKEFQFLCSSIRRDEIPDWAKNKGIQYNEVVCYDTISTPKVISTDYDAIVFFSPSGVRSFLSKNTISPNTILFVTGISTLNELPSELNNTVVIPQSPRLESIVQSIRKYFLNVN